MIQLTTRGLVCSGDPGPLTAQFKAQNAIRFRQLVHPQLLPLICSRLDRGNWITHIDGKIGREVMLEDLAGLHVLHFAANTPEFLVLVQEITECSPIGSFHGRVYRMLPEAGHYDTWHDDVSDQRLVGMSINLGLNPYRGGVFQLRERTSSTILCEMPNIVQGDAILFRISPHLQHRVTPIEGTEPKTAFAGWFRSGERNFYSTVCRPASVALLLQELPEASSSPTE
jgi:hypothetical protein